MNRTEEFLDLYRELESVASNTYEIQSGGGVISRVMRRPEFKHIRSELDYIRDVRNLLAHRPRIGDEYAVEPTEAMIELLKKTIDRVSHPSIAENIMVKRADVFCCSKTDQIFAAVREMYQRTVSHLPILEDGRVIGVFSDNRWIRCTISGEYHLTEESTFSEIEKELDLDNQEKERFLFTDWNTPVDELSDVFEEASKKGEKIGMIFVTEHGKRTEKLLGIITAWEVAAAF